MLRGSCLCGMIEYAADELTGPIVHCHCITCRKAHASPMATTARVARAGFRWLNGANLLGSFESSPGKLRHFCTQCGSHLMAEWQDQDSVILRLASLDTDPGERPKAHIWASHDLPWLDYGDNLPQFDTIPHAKSDES